MPSLPGWHYLTCSCLFWAAYGIVPEPQNVRVHSILLNSVVQWDPPNFHKENVTYTVQYKQYSDQFIDLCNRTVLRECDISQSIFGTYIIRVRTELEKEQSKWVNITFNPFNDTTIGSPEIYVKSKSRGLYVGVTDPHSTRDGEDWSVKQFYGHDSVIYSMLLWKKGYEEQARYMNITHNSILLSDLDPETMYCLKVQAFIPERNKRGEWSRVFCEQPTDNGVNPVHVTVILLSVLVSFPLCFFMILPVYRRAKYVFFPSYSLPQHFREFLSKPFYSSQFLASQSHEEDCAYDKIIVISEE